MFSLLIVPSLELISVNAIETTFFFKVQADLNRKLFFLEQCLLIQYSLDVREKEAWKESF